MKVNHIIFDLDNTLYPCTGKMDQGITERMTKCVAEFFNIGMDEAWALRKSRIQGFSTTLEWLIHEGLTDTDRFFAAVHPENEADELMEDEKLRPYLKSIEIPKIILTNAPREHAERVLAKLKVRDLFDEVCDIRDMDLLGKPYKKAYEKALEKCGGTLDDTVFVDDMQKYVDGYKILGGTAFLVGDKNGRPLNTDSPAVWKGKPEREGRILRVKDVYGVKELIQKLEME